MSKENDNAAQQPQQPIQTVRSYFTAERNAAINDLPMDQMYQLLKELESSTFWTAILKYNQERLKYTQNSLIAGDPFKDPTNMARTQGIMMGISDLQNAIIHLVTAPEKEPEDL